MIFLKKGTRALVFILAAILLVTGCTAGGAKNQEFLIGVIPAQNEGNSRVGMEKLSQVMTEKMGRKVRAEVYPDYNGVVEAMGAGKIHMAYLGPLTYVQAHEKYGAKAIATIEVGGVPYYYSYLIAPVDSPYNSFDDVIKNADKISFAFGDQNSTSGSLVPGMALKKAGVFETTQKYKFKKVTYTGNHDATALAIQNKTLDVGAIDSAIYANLVKQNKVDGSKIKKIWQSEQLFQYPWAVEKNVGEQDIKKLQEALYSIKDKDILNVFNGADAFIPAKNEDYAAVRQAALEDGRLK
ncbi:phosphate/phosphite/phosphonate ABC transporter substrate-binding protein [Paenibacillus silviterrae]|uniref:phosphate/phosphite/phosphonate ABC transporter substrate-binding protein n=1 Tax=Paenibacillus silviterrae TaxID=3242194 RepID=UPI00254310AF|nr:phosphate/phosphite/phosphonate ABC transporter substrate-binding protein [Paenibacillus chinjuensis]